MIMCNHCGFKAPDGALNCPKCGAPLPNKVDNGFSPRLGGQEQPEIPAWLESLRVGERPTPATQDQANFSAAELIDEGTVPSWMRSQRDMSSVSSVSDAFNALHPSSSHSNNTGNNQQNITAQSLIDEQALPSWMREGQMSSTVPPSGFNAANLVDPEEMPEWMKSLQQSQIPATSSQSVPPVQASQSSEAVPAWMQSLQPQASSQQISQPAVTQPSESMPEWMKSLQSQASAPQPVPPTPIIPPTPTPFETSVPASQGFSVQSLIDEQALPSWMKQQSGQAPAVKPEQPAQPGLLSPSSLIDQDAVPSWMREGGLSGQTVTPSQPLVQPQQAWQQPSQPIQPQAQQNMPVQGGLSAASFIDMNALPGWMQQSSQSSMGTASQQENSARGNSYSGTPRVENMRVPSRPRSDVSMSNESNEVAANVFASMLGVASASPQFSNAEKQQQQQPIAQYGQQYGTVPPMAQNIPLTPNGNPYQPGQVPMQGVPPTPSQNLASMQGVPNTPSQVYSSGIYGAPYTANSQVGVNSMGGVPQQYQQPYSNTGSLPPSGMQNQSDEQKNPKKRGLVDTLLGWLFH